MELVLTQNNGTTTMTSLQLVDYINYLRKKDSPLDYTELRHIDFMKKVLQVIKVGVGNFSQTYIHPQNGQEYPLYVFPKREAMLMAMSYSYDIQAVVYDAWEAAENALLDNSTITLPNFLNPAEAAKAWAVQYERNVESTKQLVIAQEKVAEALPKIEAFDTYMEKGSNIDGDNASRVLKVGRNKLYDSLRKNGYFTNKNLPSQQFTQKGSGLFYTIVTWQTDNYGFEHEKVKVLFTPKGIEYFTRKVAQGKLL
jgi:phage antirepressor YoqD-like protein